MSAITVAKKDFRDGMRSKALWLLTALFVLFVPVVAAYDVVSGTSTEDGIPVTFVLAFVVVMVFLVPVTALVVSIKSIVRERSLGTIKLLLVQPHTRGEVFFGKLLGRTALMTVAILVAFVPAAVILGLGVSGFPVGWLVAAVVVLVLFGFTFLVIGLCASTMTRSETGATVAGFAIFVLVYAWDSIFAVINWQLDLVSGNAELFVHRFNLSVVGDDVITAVESLWNNDVGSASTIVSDGADAPFYLQHWFAFVLLGVWIGLPLAIGYWRMNRMEL
ncbi:ABC transporter permease subunit [Halovivax gelatinilyticus]|uniref:ABC transporter permease subunit n=1 Tax=Halovivax gelatinilyticus TaxID=2961597 RepID=UPI0020CA6660|nr:ABC transporter permease subunit [Halovivax gelatinilyticus]